MTTDIEVWRAVPGFEGLYDVSDQGRVRSLDRVVEVVGRWGKLERRRYRGKVIRPVRGGTHNYVSVVLSVNSKKVRYTVHSLVLLTFVGPRPAGQEGRHKNCRSHDNRLTNLCYGTRGQNREDSRREGTLALGEQIVQHKLKLTDIPAIRKAPGRHEDIAASYGVSRGQISRIKRRENWGHV